MKTIMLVGLIILGGERQSCLQLDIEIVADFSSSVEGYEGYIFRAIGDFADSFQMDDQEVRIGVIAFNSTAFVALDITGKRKELDDFLATTNLRGVGSTAMDKGFKLAYDQLGILYEGMADRSAAKKIIIVISDGDVDDSVTTLAIARNIQKEDIIVYGVLINDQTANPSFMRLISSPNKFVSTDYEKLSEELNKLNFCL